MGESLSLSVITVYLIALVIAQPIHHIVLWGKCDSEIGKQVKCSMVSGHFRGADCVAAFGAADS